MKRALNADKASQKRRKQDVEDDGDDVGIVTTFLSL